MLTDLIPPELREKIRETAKSELARFEDTAHKMAEEMTNLPINDSDDFDEKMTTVMMLLTKMGDDPVSMAMLCTGALFQLRDELRSKSEDS